ncbi:unnamed protein product [Effrenium voratum]|uniref:Uncharacterized protein n=1 Tax=Effrenium voratum TaxID=2562239 RepID=A0AA36I2S5_9DINO|nr:unnamed protein product [Effrenium voratum]
MELPEQLAAPTEVSKGEFEEGVDVTKLEALLKDYVFSQCIGTLNPPSFGAVLGAKRLRGETLCVLYSVRSTGPADRPAYEKCIGDEERVSEEVVYVNDYASISQAPPR